MTAREVSRDLLTPSREDCIRAISRAMLRIRANGNTMPEIARNMNCDKSTIMAASNESNMLRFDYIAAMAFHYPEEFKVIEELWRCRPGPELTATDRLDRVAKDLEAVRREIGE